MWRAGNCHGGNAQKRLEISDVRGVSELADVPLGKNTNHHPHILGNGDIFFDVSDQVKRNGKNRFVHNFSQ